MFPIGRYLALPSDGIFPENPEELSVGYVFNDPECGDGSETHTVREWFHKFNIPLKDDYFFVNNPVPVSLLSGDRKPQIRFLGNHHSGSGNLYHKSFRM